MTDDNQTSPRSENRAESIAAAAAKAAKGKGLPPVHLWNPDFCGDIDMRIARDGSWYYMGTPIGRKPMVRLFSTILRHDDDGKYYLVTPVEKVGITVDDVPFVAIGVTVAGEGEAQSLTFRTNVEDEAVAGSDHPIRVVIDPETQEPAPYVHVRANLEALINRAVFYELVNLAIERDGKLGVWSGGVFFEIGDVPHDG